MRNCGNIKKTLFANSSTVMFCKFIFLFLANSFSITFFRVEISFALTKIFSWIYKVHYHIGKSAGIDFFQRNIWLAGTNHVVRLNRSKRGFRGSDSVLSLDFVAINNGKFPLKICVKYATSNIILAIIRKIRVSTFTSRSLDDVLVF